MRKLALTAMLFALATPAHAGSYSWTDAQGRRHFSDRPPTAANDVKIESGRLNIIANPAFNLAKLAQRVPFTQRGGHIIVTGKVNGVALPFIVDTGASLVVIPPAIARRAGIDFGIASPVTLQTAGGRVRAPRVLLAELELGGIKRHGVAAVVHKAAADGNVGLLGMSFLAAYRMSVDHDAGVLVLEPVR